MNSIETYYKGTKFRSRFEAHTAIMLDRFGIKWEYEKYNLILVDDTDYWPDFYLPYLNLFIECRGYESDEGERQIKVFSKMVAENEVMPILGMKEFDLCDYLVIRPDRLQFFEEAWRFGLGYREQSEVQICKCARCGKYFIVGNEGCYACRACGWWRGNDHLAEVINLTVSSGNLLLNGLEVSDFGKDLRRDD